MEKESKLLLLSAVIICFFGYVANTFLSQAIAKEWHTDVLKFPNSLFDDLHWVELTTFQHLVGSVLSLAMLVLMRDPIWDSDNKLTIVVAALCNVAGTLAMNAAHAMVSSSAARVIEATQPLTTFAFSVVLLKGNDSLTVSNFFSVLVIVLGVCGLIVRDTVSTGWDWLLAVALTSAFAFRNSVLKRVSCETDDYIQKFGQVSLLSVVFALPLLLIKFAFTQTFSTDMLYGLSGIAYSIYGIASFSVLESMNPVSHAILTIIIKASAFTSISNFQGLFSLKALSGVLVILIGIYLYLRKDIMHILLKLVFVMLIIIFLFAPRPVFHHSISTREASYYEDIVNFPKINVSCERISTAWTYSSPIPEFTVSNIVTLAEQNPSLPVHVYCGSKQCVDAVGKRMTENMEVEFAVVNEILKGVSPSLEQWLARHPINKVLARREFETHLQEVTVMGILLRYGGIYISPHLTLSESLNSVCQNTVPGWISQELSQWTGNLYSILDICFFVEGHPFLYELGNFYERKYHTQRKDDSVGFLWKVWNMLWNEACTIEESCLSVSHSVPSISSSTYTLTKLLRGENHFGLITKSHPNSATGSGTMLQEFAEVQFLPFVDTIMSVDNFSSIQSDIDYPSALTFLHDLGTTENWNPPSYVDPIMLSVHLQDGPKEMIQYFKEKEPIGCADTSTLKFLADRNVTSFLSGSLMQLLNSPKSREQRENIYLSNLNDNLIELLPAKVRKSGIRDGSSSTEELISIDVVERFIAIHHLIEQYRSASLVVTQCFHCASACAALGTPVIFIETSNPSSSLAAGMTSLFHTLNLHNKTRDQARAWLADFPWKNIPPNPDLGFMMKLRATAWNVIRQNQVLLDNAKKLGLIPMLPPQIFSKDRKLLFHMVFTSSARTTLDTFGSDLKQSGAFNWRHWRSVESMFRHHPTSDLLIHSNTLSQDMFDVLTEAGYSLNVKTYKLRAMLKKSPAKKFLPNLCSAKKGPYWIYVESDLVRQLVIYKYGGVYMDLDMYLVRPLHSLRVNGAAWQDSENETINNAFLMFKKKNPFVRAILKTFVRSYNGEIWGRNGPELMTKVWKKWKKKPKLSTTNAMKPYNYTSFYMIHYKDMMEDCFESVNGTTFDQNMETLQTEAYGVHVNAKITGFLGTTDGEEVKKGTLCSYLLNHFCVLCNKEY